MHNPGSSIVLVTPVWNDSVRLSHFGPELARALKESGLPVRWVVADDGSGPEEQELLRELVELFKISYSQVELMRFDKRSCKGGAIYSAWDACSDADWLAFVDADGAIDAASTVRLIERALELGKDTACVGVRQHAAATPVKRRAGRALSFRIFSFLVRRITGIHFQDTQCGAKVVPGHAYRSIAGKLEERGFIFDLELLLLLQRRGICIEELAIPWSEVAGGKVHPLRDAWPMIGGLLRIRKRLHSGEY